MMWKDPTDPNPNNRTRALRRMWNVLVYKGDPEEGKTKKESIVSWNQVDATRRAGPISELPSLVGFVTWPHKDQPDIFFINSPREGPTNKKAKPSIGGHEIAPEAW